MTRLPISSSTDPAAMAASRGHPLLATALLALVGGVAQAATAPAPPDVLREAMEAATPPPPPPPTSTAARSVAVTARAPAPGLPPPLYATDDSVTWRGDGTRPATERPAPINTLAEALVLAWRSNPQLLAARAQARAADWRYPQARAAFGPTLSVQGSYAFTRLRQQTLPGPFVGARGWASSATLILSQPLFTFGRNAAGQEQALASAQFEQGALRVTEAQVLGNVIASYVAVRRDAEAVTIARANLDLLQRQLEENRTRYSVHDITLTELDQTVTRVALGQAQLLQAQAQLGVSQKQFLQFVGAPPGDLAPPDLPDLRLASVEDAYALAESASGVIRAAQAREKISRAALRAARAEWGPRVDAQGSFGYTSLSPFNDQLRQSEIVGRLVVSQQLVDSGLRHARVRDAQESNEADWRLLDQAYRDTREAVGAAWDELTGLRTALANYREAIDAAERAYQSALVQQRTGDISTLAVLDLARDLLNVRNARNAAIASEFVARANLLAATGQLEGPRLLPGLRSDEARDHAAAVARAGDVPLLTPALSGLDRALIGDTRTDRPVRDAGAAQALDAALPLPPGP